MLLKKIAILFTSLILVTGCADNNGGGDPRQIPNDMGDIKEVTLEVRNGKGVEPDNWEKAALFLTDWDREHKTTSLYISTNYRVTLDPKTIIVESCTAGSSCGLTKAGDGQTLESIDLEHAEQQMDLLGVKSHYDMPNDGDFSEGEIWIVHSVAGSWVNTYAVELTDFKPVTNQVTLRYKVLDFRQQ